MPLECSWVAASRLAPAVVIALGLARPGSAAVLAEDAVAGRSVAAGAVLRSFNFVLGGDALVPPRVPEDASPSGIAVLSLRPYMAVESGAFKLVIHGEVADTVRSHAPSGLDLGGTPTPSRLVPLSFSSTPSPTYALSGDVDWIYAAVTSGRLSVTAGRQPITIGRGKIWRPEDLLSAFTLTSIDTEYKPGIDALRVAVSPRERTELMLIGAAGSRAASRRGQATWDGSVILGRAVTGGDAWDAGMIAGLVRGDLVGGVDGTRQLGRFLLYGEATLTRTTRLSVPAAFATEKTLFAKGLLGADLRAGAAFTISGELMLNQFGARNADDYPALLASPRVMLGEQVTLGTADAALLVDWQPHALLGIVASIIGNGQDASALGFMALRYSVSDNVVVRGGAYVPVPGPKGASSEFGRYPDFAFLELKAVI